MQHLSQKQFEGLLSGAIKGVELKNALIHAETCSVCQSKIPVLGKNDLLKLVMSDTVSEKIIDQKKLGSFWSFGWTVGLPKLGLASVLLIVFGGLAFWTLRTEKSTQIAEKPKEISNSPKANNPENNINVVENSDVTDSIESNKTPSLIADEKNSLREKRPQLERKSASIPAKITKANDDLDSLENKELARNIEVYPKALNGLESPKIEFRNNDKRQTKLIAKYPVGEVVKESQPILSWNPLKNSTSYLVKVYDEDYNEIYSQEVSGTTIKIGKPLKRGEKYQWQVIANTKDNEDSKIISSPSIFRVANNETIAKLRKESKSLWKKANVYFQEGLLFNAEKTFREILKKNPQDKLAIKYLQKIQKLRNTSQKPPTETKPAQ
jgi:Domain of Unknown Function (DUF928)